MRYTEENLMDFDITWFAVDKCGRIMVFTSGVYGNVPEFVCESQEKAEDLEEYFKKVLKQSTEIKIKKGKEFGTVDNFISLCKKGIYCFDAYDGKNHTTNYTKVMSPQNPLIVLELPENIFKIISKNVLDVDAESSDTIEVENAYPYGIQLENFVTMISHGVNMSSYLLNDIFRPLGFKERLKIKEISKALKYRNVISCNEIGLTNEVMGRFKIVKGYFEIITIDGEFVLYLVHKNDTIICDKGGLYSLQLYKKDNVIFDFNDKPGVWVEV